MVEYPKLVGPILDAKKNSQNENSTSFLFKLKRKCALGILGKKPQGAKFHELKNIDPYISLDFTKLVWPILATTKMWALFEIQNHLELKPLFLEVAKIERGFQNPWQSKWKG